MKLTRTGRAKVVSVRVFRDSENPYLWTGSIRFPGPGRWLVWLAGDRRDSLRVNVARRAVPPSAWDLLDRPLKIPTIAPDEQCPSSALDPKEDLTRLGDPGAPAWGTGPAYPVLGRGPAGEPVLEYGDPISPPSGFYGSRWCKVLWFFDRDAYQGPILIRGRQLNGMNELRFDDAFHAPPPRELRVPREARARPSYTRIRLGSPGCYAYQVDGTSFTSQIVFEAVPHRPGG